MDLCDLPRLPLQYKAHISGVTNGTFCSACSGINGDYYLDWDGSSYTLNLSGSCGFAKIYISLEFSSNTHVIFHCYLQITGSTEEYRLDISDYPQHDFLVETLSVPCYFQTND